MTLILPEVMNSIVYCPNSSERNSFIHVRFFSTSCFAYSSDSAAQIWLRNTLGQHVCTVFIRDFNWLHTYIQWTIVGRKIDGWELLPVHRSVISRCKNGQLSENSMELLQSTSTAFRGYARSGDSWKRFSPHPWASFPPRVGLLPVLWRHTPSLPRGGSPSLCFV